MTCHRFRSADGRMTGFICWRGERQRLCSACKSRPASLLCDFPLSGKKQGRTCDRPLCRACAVNVPHKRPQQAQLGYITRPGKLVMMEEDTYDLCPAHAKVEPTR